ncbi:MAG: hypothetical protein J5I92_11265 [Thiogranum sp.]|nr:hypothetical protein [Thiogranum sp.]
MGIESELTAEFTQGDRGAESRETRRQTSDRRSVGDLVTLYRPRFGGLLVLAGYLLVAFLIYAGWKQRLEWPLTAESGAGYALGIIGGSLMLLLMLYPLRKHARFMRRLGPVKYWFRTHMLFGVLGPVCILFHCGFQPGSLNSNAALFCMLIVASSGLVGRYFYTRIHHGLYGRKATLEELQRHAELLKQSLAGKLEQTPWILERIAAFEAQTSGHPGHLLSSLWTLLSLGFRTWALYLWFRIARVRRQFPAGMDRSLPVHIGARLASIRKVAEFRFYERLFAGWHILHFPLFLMLILSGVIHVIAVHMY